jgi:hypothetical protein
LKNYNLAKQHCEVKLKSYNLTSHHRNVKKTVFAGAIEMKILSNPPRVDITVDGRAGRSDGRLKDDCLNQDLVQLRIKN